MRMRETLICVMAESPHFPRLIGNPDSCEMNTNGSVDHGPSYGTDTTFF